MGKTRFAVGIHACMEAVRVRPQAIRQVLLRQDQGARLKELKDLLERQNVRYKEVGAKPIDKIAGQNQGVAIELDAAPRLEEGDILNTEAGLYLGLDGIEDPHNLGAILRTAWLMGVRGVILTSHSSVGLTPAVHKVACGAVEHVPTLNINKFSDLTDGLKQNGFWIYGLAGEGKTSIFDYAPAAKTLLLVGAEEKGLRQSTRKLCDELVQIPQISEGPSYNASVAAAISIAETQRQRGEIIKKF